MKDNLKKIPEEKPSNTLTTKDIVVTVSIVLLFASMLIFGIIQYDKNVKLEKIVSTLMGHVLNNKSDILDVDLKHLRNHMNDYNDINDLICRVQKNELELKLNQGLHQLMMDTDKSILDASNATIQALVSSIKAGEFEEYYEVFNCVKVTQNKTGE